jgi:hypothetical protein
VNKALRRVQIFGFRGPFQAGKMINLPQPHS